MKTIRQILDGSDLGESQREIVEYILGLQGYLPFERIDSYGSRAEAAGIEFAKSLIDSYKGCKRNLFAMRKELASQYMPRIESWYYKQVLDLDVCNNAHLVLNGCIECNYRANTDKFWYSEKIDGNAGDCGVFFLSRWTGKHIKAILTDYYSIKWGVDVDTNVRKYIKEQYFGGCKETPAPVVKSVVKHTPIQTIDVIDLDADNAAVNATEEMSIDDEEYDYLPECSDTAIDIDTWKPRKLGKHNLNRIQSYIKDKDGKWMKDYRLSNGVVCCRDHLMQIHGGECWTTTLRPKHDCDTIDRIKDFIYERKMHLAVNQPKGGWAYSLKNQALVYEGVFAKSAKKDGQVRVAMLYRMMQPDKDGRLKKFAKGSKPIPYLLDNVRTQRKDDKYIYVCEGMGDACFVRNGIALNNWIPTADYAMPFINRYKSKGCKIVYMTDNWMVGDKGGMRALMYAKKHDPERLMLDWGSIKCKAKDVGELVVEMDMSHYESGKNLASERQHLVYEMPREWIMEHVKMAKDIDTRYCNTLDDNGYYNLDTIFS